MPFPQWAFREMERGEINVDPVHDEFFKVQDLADALVRESIQNSLDARRGNSTVHVRFRFARGAHALSAQQAAPYLRGFFEHFSAAMPELAAALPREAAAMPFLVIEDSGTRGLGGDPAGDPDLDEHAARNDFYYFWRNVGRSRKGELERGRWGLGKAVFAVSSRIRTLFGLTHRAADGRRLLLGQSVLKTHVINGTKIGPYGFFGALDRHLPLPLESTHLLEQFARDFGIERDDSGLSIVIPWVREEDLSLDTIAASAIQQYFYPIVRGDLVVRVEDGERRETIDSRTIDETGARLVRENAGALARLCDLTRWSASAGATSFFTLQLPAPGQPKWSESLLPPEDLDVLRDQFERGEPLALRVPVRVKKKRAHTTSHSHFDVFLQRDDSLRRAEPHFIRRGITISDVRVPNDKPVRALAVVDDDALSTLLGDAENPAHSDWMERADRIKQYELGPSTVRFVRQSIAQLSAMLSRPPAGRVRDFLADVFSIDISAGGTPDLRTEGEEGGGEEGHSTPSQVTSAAPSRKGPRITPVSGGFIIRGDAGGEDVGLRHQAQLAYRCRTGNPFRKADPFDFELEKSVSVAARGASTRATSFNTLEFTPSAAGYEIELTGFDRRRDVVVRVVALEADASEAELH